jgi:hypothetical protein
MCIKLMLSFKLASLSTIVFFSFSGCTSSSAASSSFSHSSRLTYTLLKIGSSCKLYWVRFFFKVYHIKSLKLGIRMYNYHLFLYSCLGGADVLWKSIDEDFQHEDWRIRFSAVEKVTTTFRSKTNPI